MKIKLKKSVGFGVGIAAFFIIRFCLITDKITLRSLLISITAAIEAGCIGGLINVLMLKSKHLDNPAKFNLWDFYSRF